jgi:hypothetical protein
MKISAISEFNTISVNLSLIYEAMVVHPGITVLGDVEQTKPCRAGESASPSVPGV